ncbi:MAG: hypothetical protein AAB928_02440 [Patescibacteria group bacterium]
MPYLSYKSFLAALVPCDGINCTLCDFFSLAQNIFNFVALTLVPIVAVLLIFWGGYMFLISGGNPGGITKAKSILKNTVIGIVVVYTAYLAASYLVIFFAGGSSVAGSSFTSSGFVVQCERVELENKTGIEIGDLTEEAPGEIDPDSIEGTDIPGIKLGDSDVDIISLNGNVQNGLSNAASTASQLNMELLVTSAYRSRSDQQDLAAQNCQDPTADRCVAKPGGVETCIPRDDGANCRHTTGKAVDVWCWQNNAKCYQATLFNQIMKPNGFCFYKGDDRHRGENWHFELKADLDQDPARRPLFSC